MYLLCVPFFVPEIPYLEINPVLLYFEDQFKKPNHFSHDIVINIETTFEDKYEALS